MRAGPRERAAPHRVLTSFAGGWRGIPQKFTAYSGRPSLTVELAVTRWDQAAAGRGLKSSFDANVIGEAAGAYCNHGQGGGTVSDDGEGGATTLADDGPRVKILQPRHPL